MCNSTCHCSSVAAVQGCSLRHHAATLGIAADEYGPKLSIPNPKLSWMSPLELTVLDAQRLEYRDGRGSGANIAPRQTDIGSDEEPTRYEECALV